MTKKQRNRKTINQNKRNRMVNRRYLSTIKTYLKLSLIHAKKEIEKNSEEELIVLKQSNVQLVNNLYSILDKAVKKGVIHKNKAARKKSKIHKLLSNRKSE